MIEVNPVHLLNAASLIEVTEFPNVTDVNPEHSWNAYLPIVSTESGITNKVNPLQPLNAYSPIEVTEFPIVTDVNPEHRWNALSPMNLVPSFILQVVNALLVTSTKYVSAYLILSITGSEVHPENAE